MEFSINLEEDSPQSSKQRGSHILLDLQKDPQGTDSGTQVREDPRGWPSSFLPKLAAKSGGRFISRLPFSSALASEGPLPSIFFPILLLSLFRASSNPTTLSRCLRTLGNLVRSGGVTSLVPSRVLHHRVMARAKHGQYSDQVVTSVVLMLLSRILCGSYGAREPSGGVVSLPLVMPKKVGEVVWRLFDLVWTGLIVIGPTDGATDYANIGTIKI
ncbi:hypothetical protein Tco_1066118 [Tanacetum coccineum]